MLGLPTLDNTREENKIRELGERDTIRKLLLITSEWCPSEWGAIERPLDHTTKRRSLSAPLMTAQKLARKEFLSERRGKPHFVRENNEDVSSNGYKEWYSWIGLAPSCPIQLFGQSSPPSLSSFRQWNRPVFFLRVFGLTHCTFRGLSVRSACITGGNERSESLGDRSISD